MLGLFEFQDTVEHTILLFPFQNKIELQITENSTGTEFFYLIEANVNLE